YRAADRIDVVRIRVARIQIETQRAKGLIQRLQLGSLAASALTVGGETLAAAEGGGRLDAAPVDLVQCEVDLQRVERPELASQLVAPHRVGSIGCGHIRGGDADLREEGLADGLGDLRVDTPRPESLCGGRID